jgi:hypothetical protein
MEFPRQRIKEEEKQTTWKKLVNERKDLAYDEVNNKVRQGCVLPRRQADCQANQ